MPCSPVHCALASKVWSILAGNAEQRWRTAVRFARNAEPLKSMCRLQFRPPRLLKDWIQTFP